MNAIVEVGRISCRNLVRVADEARETSEGSRGENEMRIVMIVSEDLKVISKPSSHMAVTYP